jgi:ABC-2 type transport system permease protein
MPASAAHRIRSVVVKEFRQILRDPRTLGVLLVVPAFLLVMYGYALDLDVTNIRVAVYDADKTAQSRELIDRMFLGGRSEYFRLEAQTGSADEVERMLLSEQARVGLVIPAGFGADRLRGAPTAVQVLIDGVNASEAATAAGLVEAYIRQHGAPARTTMGGIDYRPRTWYNPELRSAFFLIPGLIAFILMVITVVATSLSIVREREHGSMEQLIASPLHPFELVAGKLIPYGLVSAVSVVLIVLASVVMFEMPVRGSLWMLAFASGLFVIGALGLGLLISTVSRTQETAFMLAVMSTMLPTFILSGFVFPISNMPMVVQAITYAVPARYFLEVLRDVMLKGAPVSVYWDQLVFLAVFAAVVLGAGTLRLRRIMG